MSRGRLRFLAALLLAFAVWPPTHYLLVQHYRLNPWKFGGWAMYTIHVFEPKLEVFALDEGRRVKLPLTEPALREAAAARDALARDSREYGLLATPDELARLVRDALQPSEGVEVVVERYRVDPVPGRVSVTRESHLYLSDGRVVRELGK